jgi:hypothetical protein
MSLLNKRVMFYTTYVHTLYNNTDVKMIFTIKKNNIFCTTKKKKLKIIFTSVLFYNVCTFIPTKITFFFLITILESSHIYRDKGFSIHRQTICGLSGFWGFLSPKGSLASKRTGTQILLVTMKLKGQF